MIQSSAKIAQRLITITAFFSFYFTQAQTLEFKEFEVYFNLDSDKLQKDARKILDDYLFGEDRIRLVTVEVFGHCDTLGSDEYNIDLSKRRVQSVKLYLLSKGIELREIATNHFGRDRPKYPNLIDSLRPYNRRCEIVAGFVPKIPGYSPLKITDLALEKGQTYELPNLHFISNQVVPHYYSYQVLNDLLKVLYQREGLYVELQGHVCCTNDMELSHARARFVYDFLRSNGISAERLSYKGYGNKKPNVKEVDDESRMRNRRVDIHVSVDNGRTQDKLPQEVESFTFLLRELRFFPGKAGMAPSSRFSLKLIGEDIGNSSGFVYTFYVDAPDDRVFKMRKSFILKEIDSKNKLASKLIIKPLSDFDGKVPKNMDLMLTVKKQKK